MAEPETEPLFNRRREYAESIADYVETHGRYDTMTKREAVVNAVLVMTDDIGAAQGFLQAIGVPVDLYGDS